MTVYKSIHFPTQTLNLKLQHLASGVKQKSGGEKQ